MSFARSIVLQLHYAQFEIWDHGVGREPGETPPEAFEQGFILSDSFLSVLAQGDGRGHVTVESLESVPALRDDVWERVFEVSLYFPSGHFQVHECAGLAIETFAASPGWSRFRVHERQATRSVSDREFFIQYWPSQQAKPNLFPMGAV